MDVARGSSSGAPPLNPYTFTRQEYEEFTRSLPHAQFNEQSEYEEKVLVEGCTLFDIYRQPRAPVVDPKVARTIPVETLRSDLKCPVCLGIIQKATVVMECLHRFCGECIQKCIGSARKECPSCRQHIPSKRSLRKDENFDRLIQKIIPNVEEFERREAQLIEELNRARHLNNALTESTRRGLQNQATIRRHVRVVSHASCACVSLWAWLVQQLTDPSLGFRTTSVGSPPRPRRGPHREPMERLRRMRRPQEAIPRPGRRKKPRKTAPVRAPAPPNGRVWKAAAPRKTSRWIE